ncbi:GNAT family N-acetyltransferase [Streptomyces buecherae]|uniref:GNAT family N-acetyltransferase n=1 Tax=Streptomyces buecherae TaxID=2763006 RepID=UPI00379BE7E9
MFAKSLGDDGAELRPLEPWHAEEYFTHIDRSREFIGRYIGLADAAADLDSARAFLQSYADKTAADGGRIYGIWLDGTLVGGVLFRVFDAREGTCEVGCWLEETATGRGLVTRAITVLIDWAVDVRGIHRVEWQADAANAASLKAAQRLGFVRDGVLRGSFARGGGRRDVEVWSALAPEWRERRAARTRG